MPRYSLTISDLDERQLAFASRALADLPDPLQANAVVATPDVDDADEADEAEETPETDAPKKRTRRKKAAPATLPATAAVPAPTPAPAAPVASADPEPVTAPPPPPAPVAKAEPAAPTGGAPTLDTLVAKARTLAVGPFKQTALVAVLQAIGAPSLPKVPEVLYPQFDALLDAAVAYGTTAAPSIEWFKNVCKPGEYAAATAALVEANNAALGL